MYKINESKMFYDMEDGQAVVINSSTGVYYGTSAIGSAVLDAVVNGAGKESIITKLKALAGCPADIEAKLDAFFKALVDKEILISDDAAAECPDFAAEALADGFDFPVEEFSEVQDLILADPIHEVNIDEEWNSTKDE